MGRRRLLPNINTLLLQFHLPHRSGSNAKDSSTKNETSDHHHHHHVFHWPSLKRKPATSDNDEDGCDDDHNEHDHHVVYGDLPVSETPTSQKSLVGSSHSRLSTKSAVSFGNCDVRTYPQILGDHPCCSEGCPIQLGWSYVSEESFRIDDYDSKNEQHRNHHRVQQELRLTPEERRSILILSKQKLKDCNSNSNIPVAEGCDSLCQNDGLNAPSTATPADVEDSSSSSSSDLHHQHERELIRECRRLHRCGGWNVNLKASRKRNKRTQQAFFGSPRNKETTIAAPKEQERLRSTAQDRGKDEAI